MKKIVIVAILICTIHLTVEAQYYLGFQISPAMSTFHHSNRHSSEFYIFPVSYGVTLDYKYNKFVFSTGLSNVIQGHGFEVMHSNSQFPGGTGEFYDVFIRVKTLMISQEINYSLFERPKSYFFVSVGLNPGYIYSQQIENTSLPLDFSSTTSPNYTVIPITTTERVSDVEIFDNFYLGLNLGIGWRQHLSDRFQLQLRPNFLYQIRSDESRSLAPFTYRMMTFSLDMGVYFKLL